MQEPVDDPAYEHERHKPPQALAVPRALVLACPPLRSRVNLARIVRVAGCCGVRQMIVGGHPRIDRKIARDALDVIEIEYRRSLAPALERRRAAGYRLVGLEQASGSVPLPDFRFERRTVLVVGHERLGLQPALLRQLDAVVEIPVWGRPLSYNVATAAAMALYEYCRQFPRG